ncbi:hypothetical protein [Oceanisphaera psychrotolerans]|uniref:Uncharacterized protein n=1 Tax=Oceanisphaera psychrotolerans TaxID=1414654 RepID=A0A1J4QCJ3_9GAMM|nr:hypothetical protein [Oceanisphaera psychrotolerans]OIN09103.1 hypothetical protein BFR47_02160 [Oceanisphaera psychrotolerans]
MTQIAIHFDCPVVSVDRFCELSGMTKATVQRRIEEGRIPVLPKQGKREVVMVNLMGLAALGMECFQQIQSRKQAQSVTPRA